MRWPWDGWSRGVAPSRAAAIGQGVEVWNVIVRLAKGRKYMTE